MRPIIGITVNYDPKETVGMASGMGVAGQDWDFVSGDYIYSIERAGGIPVLLPRLEDMSVLEPLIDKLDGVLVSGGHDVDPHGYGERTQGYCGRLVPERDVMDLAITRYAYEKKKPILAICRGIQILNVALGGNLYQDLEREGGFCHHFMDNTPREYPVHSNTIAEGSILEGIYGKSEIEVNSFHHQAVKDAAPAAVITATSSDGVPEGIEVSGGHPFTIGVQWHPEMMFRSEEQQKLFRAFVKACE